MVPDKQHPHELLEQLPPAAIGVLKSLLDPVPRAIANAPLMTNHAQRQMKRPSPKRANGRSISFSFARMPTLSRFAASVIGAKPTDDLLLPNPE